VIKVAHHFAGLDMGEADILRRAMSGKYRGKKEIMRIRDKFFANCREREYPEDISAEVWRQIESFSGYSFSKAHSASFAVESYQSLFLKTYYPIEFMVAVINNFGGFYSTELYFHELKKAGATVHAPCVNYSEQLTSIKRRDVYVGLIHIQGMEDKLMETILQQRAEGGAYVSLHDFIMRTGIGPEQLNTLIRVGALRFTDKSKKELLWEANFLHRQGVAAAKPIRSLRPYRFAAHGVGVRDAERPEAPDAAVVGVIANNSEAPLHEGIERDVVREGTHHGGGIERDAERPEAPVRVPTHRNPVLFEEPPIEFHLPQLAHHALDDALDELDILGFSLCNPFDLVDDDPVLYTPAARMAEYLGQTITMLGYLITWKPVHTVKKEMMYFGTYIDAAGDWLDTVHFPDSAKLYPLQGRGFYRMTGTVVEEFGVFNLEVHKMYKIGIKDRAAVKAGSLLEKDKSWKQGLITRE
jgi:hypothetical protein